MTYFFFLEAFLATFFVAFLAAFFVAFFLAAIRSPPFKKRVCFLVKNVAVVGRNAFQARGYCLLSDPVFRLGPVSALAPKLICVLVNQFVSYICSAYN
jgi:hypothetical protein